MTSIILYDSVSLYSVDCVILTFGFQVSSKCLLTDGGWTDGSLLCEVLSAQCRVPPVCTGGLVESTPGGGKALPPVGWAAWERHFTLPSRGSLICRWCETASTSRCGGPWNPSIVIKIIVS